MKQFEARPIIALDFPDIDSTRAFLQKFPNDKDLYLKVGMELFYQAGPRIVQELKALGHSVFLDLKLHDIPNTVKSAMKVLAQLDIDLVNVHAAGGLEMMQAAREGLGSAATKLIAVTQLTSTSQETMQRDQLIDHSLEESVDHYAQRAMAAGLDGVVCSALEVGQIKKATGPEFICLTPGIRPAGSTAADQKRVVSPAQAHDLGSDYIVVGRPITQANNPLEAYQSIKKEWNK